jgi:hypothetical protein
MHKLPDNWTDCREPEQLAKARERNGGGFANARKPDPKTVPPPSLIDRIEAEQIKRIKLWAEQSREMLIRLKAEQTYLETARAIGLNRRAVAGRLFRLRAEWRALSQK